jgi:hemolysin activation/secretion protein
MRGGLILFVVGLSFFTGSVGARAEEPAPNGQAENSVSFDILEYQVDGNTVLDNRTIEKAVYPFLGPGRGIGDVEKARQALESAYHEAGYQTVFVDIPEQDVEGNIVRLLVTEGKVERLKITGSRYYSLGKIRDGVPALAAGQVPHMPTVQAQLTQLGGESPDRQVTPVLRAGNTPGKMEVELKVKDELPLHGSVEINGKNNENTTRTRLIAAVRYDNLWQRFHSASLQYQVTPENYDEVEVWAGTYVFPTGIADTRLAVYGIGISSTTDIASAGALNVVGSGSIYGFRLVKPLKARENFFHSFTFGMDYKDFDESLALLGQDTQRTPITYVPFMLGYEAGLKGERYISSLNLETNFSIRGLGNEQQEFEDKRFTARSNYLYLTGEFRHQQLLPYDLRLIGRLSGQVTESPLISNEQFSAGGVGSVRGYHQTEVLGDHGVNASLELYSPPLEPANWDFVQSLRALIFTEGAKLWVVKPLPGTPREYELASAGAGLRLQVFKHLSGELDWAYPFIRVNRIDPGEQRVDFRVSYEF